MLVGYILLVDEVLSLMSNFVVQLRQVLNRIWKNIKQRDVCILVLNERLSVSPGTTIRTEERIAIVFTEIVIREKSALQLLRTKCKEQTELLEKSLL